MHLLMFMIVKAVQLTTNVTSLGSISAHSSFAHRFYIHHDAHFGAALGDRTPVFSSLGYSIFLRYFAFPFRASEF